MSMIDSLRESVFRDNNTAQIELEGILSRMNPSTKRLQLSAPLHGELDFSILNQKGFRQVEEIIIEKGEITDIKNIPDTVHILHCQNQLLIGLFDLPAKLEELHCDYNYISIFDGKKTPELKKLSISNNRLEELLHIPNHLEELYCTHNKIKQLSLDGLNELKVLHVSDNPTLVIEHVPASLVDFKSDNSPFVNLSYETDAPSHVRPTNESVKKIDYIEALNMYMQLKRNYEETFLKSRRDVFNNAKTKSEGKRLAKQVKPKCINCKRPVGTIFSSKDDKYTAICGDANLNTKCSLNIQLYRGYHSDHDSLLYIFKSGSDNAKEAIIRQKLDTLFQYIDERTATVRFKKELDTYNSESGTFHDVLDEYNEKYFNKSRDEKIAEKKLEISELLKQYEAMINDYKTTPDNHQLLRDAIQLHIKDITPEMENLRRLKHELSEVDTQINITGANVYTIKSTLVQRKTTLANIDQVLSEPPDVIKFNKRQ